MKTREDAGLIGYQDEKDESSYKSVLNYIFYSFDWIFGFADNESTNHSKCVFICEWAPGA